VGLVFLFAAPLHSFLASAPPVPLSLTIDLHRPNLAELTAVLIDPNLGVAFAWPALALATTLGLAVTIKTRSARADTVVLLALVAAVLLVVVALPRNINHGGTRSVSRYALWLVPLSVPVLLSMERAGRRSRVVLTALAAGSLVTGLGDYHPRKAERYLTPSFPAAWIWEHWPHLDNPLPEVFAERTAGIEKGRGLPTATEGCEKALLIGDGTRQGVWPLWCRPQELSPECQSVDTYCYANRRGSEYSFVRAPRQGGFAGFRPEAWYWRGSPSDALVQLLRQFTRSSIFDADPKKYHTLFAGKHRLGPRRVRINEDSLIVWLHRPRGRAWVSPFPGPRRRAILVDPMTPRVLEDVALDPVHPIQLAIPKKAPLLLVVVPDERIPPGLR
jgi:hypothetical protein